MYILIERTPPPGGVSYLLCCLIKKPEEEDPLRSTWYKFFERGPLPLESWLGNIVNKKTPPEGGVSFDQYTSVYIIHIIPVRWSSEVWNVVCISSLLIPPSTHHTHTRTHIHTHTTLASPTPPRMVVVLIFEHSHAHTHTPTHIKTHEHTFHGGVGVSLRKSNIHSAWICIHTCAHTCT